MDELQTFSPLACPACHGEEFSKVVGLQSRAQSGNIEPPKGYQCLGCHLKVDLHTMQADAELAVLERQITERKAQMAALRGTPTSSGSV